MMFNPSAMPPTRLDHYPPRLLRMGALAAASLLFIYVYRIPADPLKEEITPVTRKPEFRSEYLHFSRDGKQLVTAHEDGTVRLWQVRQTGA